MLAFLKSAFYAVLIVFMVVFILSFLTGFLAFLCDILRFRLPHDKKWVTIDREVKRCQNQVKILKTLKVFRRWLCRNGSQS